MLRLESPPAAMVPISTIQDDYNRIEIIFNQIQISIEPFFSICGRSMENNEKR